MKKIVLVMITLITLAAVNAQESFYDFKVQDIEGKNFDFSVLKGKKVLIVNTASKCGFTSQYKLLQALFETHGGEKFTIIGFPANNFLGQEPGTNHEIEAFCQKNYGVTFPMMSKISVKGDDIHPVYQWLTSKNKNGVRDSKVSWNFQKYLIDENGRLVDVVEPKVKPDDVRITGWLNQ